MLLYGKADCAMVASLTCSLARAQLYPLCRTRSLWQLCAAGFCLQDPMTLDEMVIAFVVLPMGAY